MTEKNELTEKMAKFAKGIELPAGSRIEIVGEWVWIETPEKPSDEIRKTLSQAGFRWIKKRERWAHPCGRQSRHGKYDPRLKYNVELVAEVK